MNVTTQTVIKNDLFNLSNSENGFSINIATLSIFDYNIIQHNRSLTRSLGMHTLSIDPFPYNSIAIVQVECDDPLPSQS